MCRPSQSFHQTLHRQSGEFFLLSSILRLFDQPKHLFLGQLLQLFLHLKKMSQSTVKECNLISAPISCDLDPITSKLLIECLDSIHNSRSFLFNSSLVSSISPQCFKSALVTPIINERCLYYNDLYNYRPVYNFCFNTEKHWSYLMFLATSTNTIITTLISQHFFLLTALKQLF